MIIVSFLNRWEHERRILLGNCGRVSKCVFPFLVPLTQNVAPKCEIGDPFRCSLEFDIVCLQTIDIDVQCCGMRIGGVQKVHSAARAKGMSADFIAASGTVGRCLVHIVHVDKRSTFDKSKAPRTHSGMSVLNLSRSRRLANNFPGRNEL